MVLFGDLGLQLPTYEEQQGATILANAFVERLKKQPELMPSSVNENLQSFLKDQPKVFESKYDCEIDFLSKSEVYFRYKELMAKQEITLYHSALEEFWASDQIKLDRAYSFLDYLKEHPALLPEGINAENLDKVKLTKEKTDCFAYCWGMIYSSSLSGITIDSPNQIVDEASKVTWGSLLTAILIE